jgi:hypothetical protein
MNASARNTMKIATTIKTIKKRILAMPAGAALGPALTGP